MSERLKRALRGPCGVAGRHHGPFDPADGRESWGCSTSHVEEFGDCEGIVQGAVSGIPHSPETSSEVDVRWQPSNLRYAYRSEDLEKSS